MLGFQPKLIVIGGEAEIPGDRAFSREISDRPSTATKGLNTHPKHIFDLNQEYRIQPSMPSPGCPYDNTAMENFFGTLKTECLYRRKFSCRAKVEQAVAEYVQFYSYERIDLKNGLTPFEIRSKAV